MSDKKSPLVLNTEILVSMVRDRFQIDVGYCSTEQETASWFDVQSLMELRRIAEYRLGKKHPALAALHFDGAATVARIQDALRALELVDRARNDRLSGEEYDRVECAVAVFDKPYALDAAIGMWSGWREDNGVSVTLAEADREIRAAYDDGVLARTNDSDSAVYELFGHPRLHLLANYVSFHQPPNGARVLARVLELGVRRGTVHSTGH